MKKPNILFIHHAYPSQHSDLHDYLNQSWLANSYFFCSENSRRTHQFNSKNLYSFVPNKDVNESLYYYSGMVEKSSKISLGILGEVLKMKKEKQIDIIVAHGSLGSPHFLFDEVGIPIISYVEFPSFRHHGHDKRYPPDPSQRYVDKNFEMLSYYEAIKSDATLVPSEYAKNMYPPEIRGKVVAQMEGFNPKKLINTQKIDFLKKEKGTVYIGYVARGLSSAKGFEQFIKISKEIIRKHQNVRFVVIGDPAGAAYGFESFYLKKKYKEKYKTFKDYVLDKEKVDMKYYNFVGKLEYKTFSKAISEIDFFLYPLQFGSANWGLFEIMLRKKIIIGSERCFIPEVITDGQNGFICDYDNIQQWVDKSSELIMNLDKYKKMEEFIAEDSKRFHIDNVAKDYMKLFNQVIEEFNGKK